MSVQASLFNDRASGWQRLSALIARLPRTVLGFAGLRGLRSRTERAAAARYQGCSWGDSTERGLIDHVVARGGGW